MPNMRTSLLSTFMLTLLGNVKWELFSSSPVRLLSLREGMDFHGWKMGWSNRFWREPGQRWSLVSVSSSHLTPPLSTNCEFKRAKLLLQATCWHLLGEASHCWRGEGSHAIPSDSSIHTSLLSSDAEKIKNVMWSGEMAQWWRAMAAFPEDLVSIPSAHMVA